MFGWKKLESYRGSASKVQGAFVMRALLVSEPTHFELVTIPEPECGIGQVLIRTAYCGICGTDLEILYGNLPRTHVRFPLVPGHEWTGAVVEVGPGVANCAVGDRVSVEGYLSCAQCSHCRAGETNLCENHEQIGFTHNGGFAEYVVAPARLCHKLPVRVGFDEGLMVEPAATVMRGIDRLNAKDGFNAAVIGCGPIGQIAIRVLLLHKPSSVLGIDLAEHQQSLALQAGATRFTSSVDSVELRQMSCSDGWDVVVNCATGNKAIELAFEIVRPGGHAVIIGGTPEGQRMSCQANLFVMKDLRVTGVCGYTTHSWVKVLDLLDAGQLRLGDLITHRVPIDNFDQALKLLHSRSEPVGKVILT
jgi:L-iditol 2-dehydrogenase